MSPAQLRILGATPDRLPFSLAHEFHPLPESDRADLESSPSRSLGISPITPTSRLPSVCHGSPPPLCPWRTL